MKRNCIAHLIWKGPKLGFGPNTSEAAFPSVLDDLGVSYLLMTAETADIALQLRRFGHVHDGRQYDTVFAIPRDDGAKMILFERDDHQAPKTEAQFLRRLRRKANITSWESLYKFMKYIKRDLAPHMQMVEGTFVHQHDDGNGPVYTIWIPELGRNITAFCPDIPQWLEHLFDGFMNISMRFASDVMGKAMPFGSGLRATVNMENAFYKGHGLVRTLNYDIVLYGGKKQLMTEDGHFRFGVMQELHASKRAHSDIQTVVNIGNAKRLPDYADIQLAEWGEALSDNAKMMAMLDSMIQSMTDRQDKLDAWSVLEVAKAGLPVTQIPAMRRKLEFFRQRELDMQKLRVAYPANVARDRYMIPDWTAIDDDGLFTNNGVLTGSEIVMPGVPMWDIDCMLIRRPMANPYEKAFGKLVTYPEYWTVSGDTPFVFVSMDQLTELIKKLGGCDWDDSAQIHFDPGAIADAKAITYPVEKVQEADAPKAAAARSYRCAPVKTSFDIAPAILDRLIVSILGSTGMGIGPVSNALIVDISNTINGIQAGFKLTYAGSNLEDMIDATVHVSKNTHFDILRAEDSIRDFNKNLTVCSEFLLSTGRVPRKEKEHVIGTTDTDLDRAVAEIKEMDEAFKARLIADCWENISYPDNLLLIAPDRKARALAKEISLAWGSQIKNQIALHEANAHAIAAEQDRKATQKELDKVVPAAVKAAGAAIAGQFAQNEDLLSAWALLMKKRWIDDNKAGAQPCRDALLGTDATVKFTIAVWKMLEQADGGGLALRGRASTTTNAVVKETGIVPVSTQADMGPVITKQTPIIWTVIAGMSLKYGVADHEAVVSWRNRVSEAIWLGPVDFQGEAAIEAVTLDGMHYGWLPKGQIAAFLKQHNGSAIHATLGLKSDFSMTAVVN